MLGYGDLDAYGFHTLESLQCMVERRKDGETGIRSVEWLDGPAVWSWRDGAGRWSVPLLEAAFARDPTDKPGRMEDNVKNPVAFLHRIQRWPESCSLHAQRPDERMDVRGKAERKSRTAGNLFRTTPRLGTFPSTGALRWSGALHGGDVHYGQTALSRGEDAAHHLRALDSVRIACVEKAHKTPELTIAYRAPKEAYFQRS